MFATSLPTSRVVRSASNTLPVLLRSRNEIESILALLEKRCGANQKLPAFGVVTTITDASNGLSTTKKHLVLRCGAP